MPRTQKPIAKLGKVEYDGERYLAHVQYRDEDGDNKHIRGPRRKAVHLATDIVERSEPVDSASSSLFGSGAAAARSLARSATVHAVHHHTGKRTTLGG